MPPLRRVPRPGRGPSGALPLRRGLSRDPRVVRGGAADEALLRGAVAQVPAHVGARGRDRVFREGRGGFRF